MMHAQSLLHWKGYPHYRFPRICFGRRKSSRSSRASQIVRARKRRVSERARQHEQVFGWESRSTESGGRINSPSPDPLLMVIPSSLMQTGDGAESPASKSKDRNGSLPPKQILAVHGRGRGHPINPMSTGMSSRNSGYLSENRKYDPRISPKRPVRPKPRSITVPVSPSIKSIVQSLFSPPSRKPSQQRTLRRFTRELELHLQAVQNLPGKTLIASPSVTTIKTVQEFKPYHSEFRDAGLAVTSTEQRGKTSEKSGNKSSLPTRSRSKGITRIIDLQGLDGSSARSAGSSYTLSTDHTVMDWTPPHEKAAPAPPVQVVEQAPPVKKPSYKPSPDVILPSPTRMAPPQPGQPSTRDSIPWLRQPPAKAPPIPIISSRSPMDDRLSVKTLERAKEVIARSREFQDAATQTSLSRYIDAEQAVLIFKPRIEVKTPQAPELKLQDAPGISDKPLPTKAQTTISIDQGSVHRSSVSGYDVSSQAPVADPTKRPSPTKLKARTSSGTPPYKTKEKYLKAKLQTPLPPVPSTIDDERNTDKPHSAHIPRTISMTTSSTLGLPRSTTKTRNNAVFLGLQVATAAACDEDVDRWISEVSGTGVRKFLEDLSIFDGVGISSLAAVAKRAAKQRRNEVRAWEKVREESQK